MFNADNKWQLDVALLLEEIDSKSEPLPIVTNAIKNNEVKRSKVITGINQSKALQSMVIYDRHTCASSTIGLILLFSIFYPATAVCNSADEKFN